MPLHSLPLSRRTFLAQGAASVAGLMVLHTGFADEAGRNPHQLALFSDTHVPGSPDITARGTNMTNNIQQAVREVLALKTRPAGVLVNGDCAYLKGLPADYANFAKCVAPLSEAGVPLHCTMGNHDARTPFYEALQSQKPAQPLLESKHVTILELPHANWFLLDSLTVTDVVTGEIGIQQREWLSQALQSRPDKPAIVMAHHTPQFEPPPEGKIWGGIRDTEEFLTLLADHSQVKAFVYGHSHVWNIKPHGKIQLINLPPVAYIFDEGKPNGWVLAESTERGLTLDLHTIDKGHKQNAEHISLTWA